MTELDELLTDHVRGLRPGAVPPLAVLRRRASRRRRVRAVGAAAAVLGVLGVGAAVLPGADGGRDRAELADPALEPRDPPPGLGALSGAVSGAPEAQQRRVTLVFTAETGGGRYTVETVQGGAWTIDAVPGSYRVTAEQGGDVCAGRVSVTANTWRRQDVVWPCVDPEQPRDPAVLLGPDALADTYGGPWSVDEEFRDAGLPQGCAPVPPPASRLERSLSQSASGVLVSQRILQYRDVSSAAAAQGALIDAVEACDGVGQGVVGGIPGSSAQLVYGRSTAGPDVWFALFTADDSVVQVAVTTPDSTEEQAALAVQALVSAARTALG